MSADQDDKREPEAKKGATTTLLELAIGQHLAGQKAISGRQVELFEQGDQLPDDDGAGALAPGGKRGPGRPPGAGNKATEAFRRFVRGRFGDPFIKLMEMAFADPKTLAQVLGAPSVWDVVKQQQEWRLRLMPYLHSAMPAELKLATTRHLAISLSAQPGGPAGDRELQGDPIAALLEFQRVSEASAEQLHVTELHAEATFDDRSKG